MATKIQVRRGTASQWTTSDPTLSEGEVGFETDTNKFKIGDGSTAWTALDYAGGSDDPVMLSDSVIAENYEIPAGANALSVGPVEVDTGVEVTVPTGSVWEISPWDAALSINDLSDVNTSGVSEGEVLTYSSGSWSFSSLPTLPKIQAVSQVIPSGTTNPFTITFPEAFSTVPTVVCQFEAVGYPEGGTLIVIENSITTTQFQLQLGGAGWPFTLHYIAIGT